MGLKGGGRGREGKERGGEGKERGGRILGDRERSERGIGTIEFVEGGGDFGDAAFAVEGDGEGGFEGGDHCWVQARGARMVLWWVICRMCPAARGLFGGL